MLSRWLIALSLLAASLGAAVHYDMSKEALLKELGKPTSILKKGGREVLIYPQNVRIEIEQGKVVSVKGLDLAAEEAAATPPPAEAEGETAPAEPAAEEEPKLTPAEQKARDEAEAKLEKAMAETDTKARAEMEKTITELESLDQQPVVMPAPVFSVGAFVVELVVKWLLMLAALKLTAKYWSVDIEWKGLMIAAAADTGVRALVLGIGEGLLGLNGSREVAFIRITHGATTELGIRPQYDTLAGMKRVYEENGWKAVEAEGGTSPSAPLEATPPGAASPTIAAQVVSGARIDVIGIPSVLWWP